MFRVANEIPGSGSGSGTRWALVRRRAQVEGVAASLKKTQVQGQSSPERRLSEEQKERLKKQVSIWAERTRKDD